MGNYAKSKSRASYTSFFGIPKEVLAHENFTRLSDSACKLLLLLGEQYNGRNNGNLEATFKTAQSRNWSSKDTLHSAIDCLIHYGMIIKTRQGYTRVPCLYAFTWTRIDEIKGKTLDVAETVNAPGNWKLKVSKWTRKKRKNNKLLVRLSGQTTPKIGVNLEKKSGKWDFYPENRGINGHFSEFIAPITVLPL